MNKLLWPSSTNVYSTTYDMVTEDLTVVFKSNLKIEYTYKKVPASVYQELIKAPSVGAYIGNYIKGKYEVQKIDKTKKPNEVNPDA